MPTTAKKKPSRRAAAAHAAAEPGTSMPTTVRLTPDEKKLWGRVAAVTGWTRVAAFREALCQLAEQKGAVIPPSVQASRPGVIPPSLAYDPPPVPDPGPRPEPAGLNPFRRTRK